MFIRFRAMNSIFKQFDLIKRLASSIRALQTESGFSHNEIDIYLMQVLNTNRASSKEAKLQDWLKQSLKDGCQTQEFLQSIIKSLQYELSAVSRSCFDDLHLEQELVQSKSKPMGPEANSKATSPLFSPSSNPFKLKGEAKQRNKINFYSKSDPDANSKRPSLFDQVSSSNDHKHESQEYLDEKLKQAIEEDEIRRKYLMTRYEELVSSHGIEQNDRQFEKLQRISKFYKDFVNLEDRQRRAGDIFSKIDYFLSVLGK